MITRCIRRRGRGRRGGGANVNLWRLFSYITIVALLASALVNFVSDRLATTSSQERPPQVRTAAQPSVSVSGTEPPRSTSTWLPCDDECRRFRRLLDAWPTDKPRAAVVLLLRPASMDSFARSSRLFSANFNDVYNYPLIIFHEDNMNTDEHRQRLRSLTNSSLYFQVYHACHISIIVFGDRSGLFSRA